MARFQLDPTGCIRFGSASHTCIQDTPIGILVQGGVAYRPVSACLDGADAVVQYPCGVCRISIRELDRYVKLTLLSAPEGADGFVFGPYMTDAISAGEILGAGWYNDGSVVCMQSLMPKVVEGAAVSFAENRSGLELTGLSRAAVERDGGVSLQLCAVDMSREVQCPDGFVIRPVPDADAQIEGAAVALLCAESADALLDAIGEMELAEGLPHPMYRGNYAKKDPRASAPYLIFVGSDLCPEALVDIACRAEVSCVYFSDLFDQWGHFTIQENTFPNGISDVRRQADKAADSQVIIGAHCLSNFITPDDAYITPVPHKHLQVRDTTVLTADISAADTEIGIADAVHYGESSSMNTFRIGDELIVFGGFDAAQLRLTGCQRGAFGTTATTHCAGDAVQRLSDHGYHTFFPDIELQDEMADYLGRTVRDCGIRKLSFDGLEGCECTGYPEYACNRFVKRVYDIVGNDFLCDGSIISHYQWHAFSYCNWGEPWYDSARRGGAHTYRYLNTQYMDRNLLPRMLGWYQIAPNRGRFEATSPQMMEYMLSRNVAFDAGSAISMHTSVAKCHGKLYEYLDLIRIWNRFRQEADIPDAVRARMQEEKTDWHLEETENGWILTELILREQDMVYTDEHQTETGRASEEVGSSASGVKVRHVSAYPIDAPFPEFFPEPLHIRIRVGEPGHGAMSDLVLYNALHFAVSANGGDYLEYTGGMELYHYDCNYNLLETVVGSGVPIRFGETPAGSRHGFGWGTLQYTTNDDPKARYMLTEIRGRQRHRIFPKH